VKLPASTTPSRRRLPLLLASAALVLGSSAHADAPADEPALEVPASVAAPSVASPVIPRSDSPAPMTEGATELFVEPETSTPLKVSNRDVNRVHCAGAIEDVIWSNEKPMSVSPAKNGNVFVKFLVRRQGEREVAATLPADLHVVCNGQVYTMILYPKPSDSVTIHLGRGRAESIQSVTDEWGALPLEERVKRITLAMFREETPSGFSRSPTRGERRDVRFYEGMSVQGVYELRAPGLGLSATEYRVVVSQATTLDERDFLLPQFGNVVGITLDPVVLTSDARTARLIVVERATTHGD
jgi:conjugal transfer pilus assembly protein TraK